MCLLNNPCAGTGVGGNAKAFDGSEEECERKVIVWHN